MSKLRILVSRRRGGLGDQICCETAVRAARARFPDAHIIWATDDWFYPLLHDQIRSNYSDAGADECIAPASWSYVEKVIAPKCDLHFELDGPEMRHQLETGYDLKESRIENWVKYVDHVPDDLCPRWQPRPEERRKVIAWLDEAKIRPLEFILVQWASAEPKKNYPHVEKLVGLLQRCKFPVVVCHNGSLPPMDVFEAKAWPFRELGSLIQLAALSIGPDSFLQHFSAAVKTPCLGLFGPTNPELYLKHYPLARYLWNSDVKGQRCENTFPCYGIQARNWWCSNRGGALPWCLEQVAPETVVDVAYDYIGELEEREFYKHKALFLSEGGNPLFYSLDPRVKLAALQSVLSAPVLGSGIRSPIPVARHPCS